MGPIRARFHRHDAVPPSVTRQQLSFYAMARGGMRTPNHHPFHPPPLVSQKKVMTGRGTGTTTTTTSANKHFNPRGHHHHIHKNHHGVSVNLPEKIESQEQSPKQVSFASSQIVLEESKTNMTKDLDLNITTAKGGDDKNATNRDEKPKSIPSQDNTTLEHLSNSLHPMYHYLVGLPPGLPPLLKPEGGWHVHGIPAKDIPPHLDLKGPSSAVPKPSLQQHVQDHHDRGDDGDRRVEQKRSTGDVETKRGGGDKSNHGMVNSHTYV